MTRLTGARKFGKVFGELASRWQRAYLLGLGRFFSRQRKIRKLDHPAIRILQSADTEGRLATLAAVARKADQRIAIPSL
jgi:hypothetical protein